MIIERGEKITACIANVKKPTRIKYFVTIYFRNISALTIKVELWFRPHTASGIKHPTQADQLISYESCEGFYWAAILELMTRTFSQVALFCCMNR